VKLTLEPERNSTSPYDYTIVACAEDQRQYLVTYRKESGVCSGVLMRYYVPPTNRRCGYWVLRNLDATSPRAKTVLKALAEARSA